MENAFEWQIVRKFDWYIGSLRINDHKLHTPARPRVLNTSYWQCWEMYVADRYQSNLDFFISFSSKRKYPMHLKLCGGKRENGQTPTESESSIVKSHENQEKIEVILKTKEEEKEKHRQNNRQNSIAMMNLPVRKLTTISIKNIVSLRQLNAIHLVLKSSLKKDIATGSIIKLATNNSSIHRSQ